MTLQLLGHHMSCSASYMGTGLWLALAAPPGTHSWTRPLCRCSAPLQGEGQESPATISLVPRLEEAAVTAQQPCR